MLGRDFQSSIACVPISNVSHTGLYCGRYTMYYHRPQNILQTSRNARFIFLLQFLDYNALLRQRSARICAQ